jgi:hypothetical protein
MVRICNSTQGFERVLLIEDPLHFEKIDRFTSSFDENRWLFQTATATVSSDNIICGGNRSRGNVLPVSRLETERHQVPFSAHWTAHTNAADVSFEPRGVAPAGPPMQRNHDVWTRVFALLVNYVG